MSRFLLWNALFVNNSKTKDMAATQHEPTGVSLETLASGFLERRGVLGVPVKATMSSRPMLSVAHLSPAHGGVANAAKQLHAGLLDMGVSSRFFVSSPSHRNEGLDHIYSLPAANPLFDYADRLTRLIDKYVGLGGMMHLTSLLRSFPSFDILHLHGMDGSWFNLYALKRLNHHHALVWTMHDKHLGTGACGYPEMWNGCERWKIGCGSCPKVKAEGWWLDGTRFVYRRKKSILASTRLAVVAPNRWMYDFIASAPITRSQTLRLISYGVDTETFSPMPAKSCRQELQLPADGKLLLAVASNFAFPRKGLHYYEPLLRGLKMKCEGQLGLVLVGAQLQDDVLTRLRRIVPVYVIGKIGDPQTLAKAYNACDIFVITSIIDNSPSVVLESLACGTPVAGFSVGGVVDMIESGRSGVLSELGATDHLAEQIGMLLQEPNRLSEMRSHCRERAVRHYGRRVQASKYLELYHEIHAANPTTAMSSRRPAL